MKKETQQSQGNTRNHGRGVFASGRKWALGAKSGIETALCQRITGTDWKNVLANRWNRKRITKKAHAGRGLETICEIPANMNKERNSNGMSRRQFLQTSAKPGRNIAMTASNAGNTLPFIKRDDSY